MTPAQAAGIIVQGIKDDEWRILVGKDAEALDRAVRKDPLEAYDLDFGERIMKEWLDYHLRLPEEYHLPFTEDGCFQGR